MGKALVLIYRMFWNNFPLVPRSCSGDLDSASHADICWPVTSRILFSVTSNCSLLSPAMSRWEISAPVNFTPMLHKWRLVVKEPLINLYHWAVTFGGASKYLDVPGVLYSLWLGTFTVAILMGTCIGGFQFCHGNPKNAPSHSTMT